MAVPMVVTHAACLNELHLRVVLKLSDGKCAWFMACLGLGGGAWPRAAHPHVHTTAVLGRHHMAALVCSIHSATAKIQSHDGKQADCPRPQQKMHMQPRVVVKIAVGSCNLESSSVITRMTATKEAMMAQL
jgi:hypothetical protein